eukprot:5241474-Pyramimonas_sp.AAC.1
MPQRGAPRFCRHLGGRLRPGATRPEPPAGVHEGEKLQMALRTLLGRLIGEERRCPPRARPLGAHQQEVHAVATTGA